MSFNLCSDEVIEEIVLVQCVSQVQAHTDEIPRSSKCRLLRVDRKWLNDATGEQALETVPRQAVVSIYLGH